MGRNRALTLGLREEPSDARDGTGIPMRTTETDGRPGKQPDGSSKTREVTLCTVWTAEGHDKDGIAERDPGSVSYSAAIESAASGDTDERLSDFAQRTDREARMCLGYVTDNRHRMKYPEFRAQGLCVLSDVVEAGCKVAIGARLKLAGMSWTMREANAIIPLRCCNLSGRLEEFWERRSTISAG